MLLDLTTYQLQMRDSIVTKTECLIYNDKNIIPVVKHNKT
jgi:hypothetical protein